MTLSEYACSVLRHEANALNQLATTLPESFIPAVDLLNTVSGKIIFTGIGKSGYVAKKIASTFSSLGIASVFLHPGEALHGELGVLSPQDGVCLFSNSGSTTELYGIAKHAMALQLPRLLITSAPTADLGQYVDLQICLPAIPEACPMGLAPTTSTILMMALGDALALCLVRLRQFDQAAYHTLHPGGLLGHHLRMVKDVMHVKERLPLVPETAHMADAIVEMSSKRFGCVGITNAQRALVGIISDGDLRRAMAPDLLARPVCHVMTPNPITTTPMIRIRDALRLMNQRAITVLFVVDEAHCPQGLIHVHDCIKVG